ncbi:ABC transporter ATP-binding protein [Roseateles sp.]|uniref:ABC transporter ATP-binding protein n=1 Tax=Roseateles sp. TaxID=1971397 RepID=UPI002DFA05B8|nr:ATP-binding cassette domain-containing protein [Roseateles sp.]HEV6966670.1 ATP-binding cassette domain-containing protein [Roseateles sp.]
MASEVLMRVENLALHAGGRELQHGLGFDVRAGEVLAIVGASGCGKSTLLRHMIGLQAPQAGRVLWTAGGAERDVHGDDPPHREIGVAFQAGALWSSMTVGENLMLPLELYTDLDAGQRERQARYKLALAGLSDPATFDAEPASLSGGMRKRAAIARALVLDPPMLCLDEPSAGLDPLTSARLDDLILRLKRDLGTGVVLVTHELDSLFAVADRMLFLDVEAHTATALGPPKELREHGPEPVREFLNRGRPARTAAAEEAAA